MNKNEVTLKAEMIRISGEIANLQKEHGEKIKSLQVQHAALHDDYTAINRFLGAAQLCGYNLNRAIVHPDAVKAARLTMSAGDPHAWQYIEQVSRVFRRSDYETLVSLLIAHGGGE